VCFCMLLVGDMPLIERHSSVVYFVSLLFGIYEFFIMDGWMCIHFCTTCFRKKHPLILLAISLGMVV